jgi:aspartyl-tRNA synthetase
MTAIYQPVDLEKLDEKLVGAKISLFGRVHNSRNKGKFCFVVLRKNIHTIQCVGIKKTLSEQEFKNLTSITNESVVDICGTLTKIPEKVGKVESCSYANFEVSIEKFTVISAASDLPFSLDDANVFTEENSDRVKVKQVTRLDNRYFDLRTPMNYCIFKMQSGVSQLFREYLSSKDFIEIHSPKLISAASEGGAAVFPVKYFNQPAFLAQSPQLYKQMAINADFDKVFEIGPVFRAENSQSHRHLCEFIGLDVEMEIMKDYYEVIETLWNVLDYIFTGLKVRYAKEYKYIMENHKFDEIIYPKKPLIISFVDGVKMLNDAGFKQSDMEDLSTENEKALGIIVKKKYDSDLFVLDKYPANVRPFYTMPTSDGKYSNSYDVILRGEEISSGSQRVNDYQQLIERINAKGVNMKGLEDYVDSFKTGSKLHGGFGLGLERIVMLCFDLKSVKRTSLFPRDPTRLTP